MSDATSLPRPAPHPSRVSAFFWEGVDAEELRVQRAAIARTQRALRSMSRSEDDQATEPALREGGR